jgi:hypothetical protein
MAFIIANHKVADFNKWKPFFDSDAERIKESGLKLVKLGRKSDDPNDVYFVWETKDPSGFKNMLQDPGLADIMKEAGVISDLKWVIVND